MFRWLFSPSRPFQKALKGKTVSALGMATLFLYSTLLVPYAQANLWKQRPNGSEAKASGGGLYARLPRKSSSFLPIQEILGGNPAAVQEYLKNDFQQNTAPIETTTKKSIPRWMRPFATPYGAIEDFYLSEALRKKHLWSSADSQAEPLVVLVQDAHNVVEAQQNIAEMLATFQKNAGLNLVGLEGGIGGFHTDAFRKLPDKKVLEQTADYFLKTKVLSGAEYFGLTAEKRVDLWGVETESSYLANVNAFRQTLPYRPLVAQYEASQKRLLDAIKGQIFGQALKSFDKEKAKFEVEEISLADYLTYLTEKLGRPVDTLKDQYPEAYRFLKAHRMERGINFKRAESQRATLIKILTTTLSQDQLNQLLAYSVELRLRRMTAAEYYKRLGELALGQDIQIERYTELKKYMAYASHTEGVDSNILFEEIDGLEVELGERLATTQTQRELLAILRDSKKLRELLHHNMTALEWDAYKTRRQSLSSLQSRIWSLSEKIGFSDPALDREWPFPLAAFEAFYEKAFERNRHLVENLRARMWATDQKVAVLVAGGFHTEGLRDILRQKDLSHVVLTPYMSVVEEDEHYLEVFARGHTNLEKLMLGEKVFIKSPPVLAVVSPFTFDLNSLAAKRALGAVYAGLLAMDPRTAMTQVEEALTILNSDISDLKLVVEGPVRRFQNGVIFVPLFVETAEGEATFSAHFVLVPEGNLSLLTGLLPNLSPVLDTQTGEVKVLANNVQPVFLTQVDSAAQQVFNVLARRVVQIREEAVDVHRVVFQKLIMTTALSAKRAGQQILGLFSQEKEPVTTETPAVSVNLSNQQLSGRGLNSLVNNPAVAGAVVLVLAIVGAFVSFLEPQSGVLRGDVSALLPAFVSSLLLLRPRSPADVVPAVSQPQDEEALQGLEIRIKNIQEILFPLSRLGNAFMGFPINHKPSLVDQEVSQKALRAMMKLMLLNALGNPAQLSTATEADLADGQHLLFKSFGELYAQELRETVFAFEQFRLEGESEEVKRRLVDYTFGLIDRAQMLSLLSGGQSSLSDFQTLFGVLQTQWELVFNRPVDSDWHNLLVKYASMNNLNDRFSLLEGGANPWAGTPTLVNGAQATVIHTAELTERQVMNRIKAAGPDDHVFILYSGDPALRKGYVDRVIDLLRQEFVPVPLGLNTMDGLRARVLDVNVKRQLRRGNLILATAVYHAVAEELAVESGNLKLAIQTENLRSWSQVVADDQLANLIFFLTGLGGPEVMKVLPIFKSQADAMRLIKRAA